MGSGPRHLGAWRRRRLPADYFAGRFYFYIFIAAITADTLVSICDIIADDADLLLLLITGLTISTRLYDSRMMQHIVSRSFIENAPVRRRSMGSTAHHQASEASTMPH